MRSARDRRREGDGVGAGWTCLNSNRPSAAVTVLRGWFCLRLESSAIPVRAIIALEDIAWSRQTVDMSVTITRPNGCPVSRSVTRPRTVAVRAFAAPSRETASRGGAAGEDGCTCPAVRTDNKRINAESITMWPLFLVFGLFPCPLSLLPWIELAPRVQIVVIEDRVTIGKGRLAVSITLLLGPWSAPSPFDRRTRRSRQEDVGTEYAAVAVVTPSDARGRVVANWR
jgi:hypothetical protein